MLTRIFKLFRLPACLLLALFVISACGLIYKQNIQQGNALEQEDLDELYIGMNKRQVSFVLGSPAIHDPFHQQRWDYIQTFSRRGGKMTQRTVTLRFDKDDLLVEIIGADQTPAKSGTTGAAAPGTDERARKLTAEAIDSAVEEVDKETRKEVKADKAEPVIKGLGERSAQDRDPEEDQKTAEQKNQDGDTRPDNDGQ